MNYFNTNISIDLIPATKFDKMLEIGNNIVDPSWTIRPYKFKESDMYLVEELLKNIFFTPAYVALIMTPANTMCKTHVDNIGGRISAINIPIQVDDKKSFFQYVDTHDNVIETLTCNPIKCWRVDIPHRVDNLKYNKNRVTLSLGFVQTIGELYEIYNFLK